MTYLDRVIQKWRIRKAAAFIRPGDEVLDIGTADGSLFKLVPGLGASVGVDPDLDPTVSPPRGVRFYKGFFPAALPAGMKFDVITLLAVLEHIPPDLQVILARDCAAHLKPGGRLIITVPSPVVDHILSVLQTLRLIDGMSIDQHYGFDIRKVPGIFSADGLALEANRTFQFGLNNLFVFEAPTR